MPRAISRRGVLILKLMVMGVLLVGACLLTYYFHAVLNQGAVFTHLFYIPIILACVWWTKKGYIVAVMLVVLLLLSHIFLRPKISTGNDYPRALMFVIVATAAIILRERIEKTQIALRESRERSFAIFESANDAIFIKDSSQRYAEVNPAMLKRYGLSREEIIGRTTKEVFNENVAEAIEQKNKHVMAGHTVEQDIAMTFQGKSYNLHVIKVPIRDAAGNVTGMFGISRDVTERKQAEHKLQGQRDRAQQYLDVAGVIMVALDPEGKVTLINRKGREVLGYPEDEILGKDWFDHFLPESQRDPVRDVFRELMAGQMELAEYHENPVLTRDGTERTISWHSAVLRDNRGRIIGTLASGTDITERKLAEEKLRRSERSLRDILRAASTVAFITTDLKGADAAIMEFSAGAEYIFGYRRQEVIGRPLAILHPAEHVAAFPHVIENMRKTGKAMTTETTLVRKSGETFPALLTTYPIFDSDEEMVGVLGISTDITERKRAEAELRRSRDYLNSIINGMHEGVLIIDRDFRIRDANESFLVQHGITRSDAIGADCHRVSRQRETPCDVKKELCPVRLVFETGVPVRTEHTHFALDGRELIVDVYAFPLLDETGNVELVVTIQDDITERKRAEEIMKHSEKLAATGRMAARVAHEINNPLAGIKNAFLLVKDAVPTDYRYYEYVERIEREIERISHIVRNMYDLYGPEQEEASKFTLNQAVDDVTALLAPRCRESEVSLSIELPEKPVHVDLPKGSLFQVLFNVIQNAIDAAPKQTSVVVKTTVERNGPRISVSDAGPGIPDELRERIFEPFFTTKRNREGVGLGLGLSISRSLVEAMGGKLHFESEPGKGTVFHIDLPTTGTEEE